MSSTRRNNSLSVSAVATPLARPAFRLDDPEERERLAGEYGFRKIGEPVPDNITLKQITDSIPAEVSSIPTKYSISCQIFFQLKNHSRFPRSSVKCSGFLSINDAMLSDLTQAFEINDFKAWRTVAITLGSVALGSAMIAVSPWYLLPFAWAWTGTAATGVRITHIFLLHHFLFSICLTPA